MSALANGRSNRRARIRRAAREQAKAFGCTCTSIDVVPGRIGGLDHAAVTHDADCPAIVGRVVAIVPPSYGRCER